MKIITILISVLVSLSTIQSVVAQNTTTTEKEKKQKEIIGSNLDKINALIADGNLEEAIIHLDEMAKKDKKNACELLSTKALLLVSLKKYDEGVKAYEGTLKKCKNNERANEGIAIAYILQAQDLKEEISMTADKAKQDELDLKSRDLYLKSIPHLKKQLSLVKKRKADKTELKSTLMKLQNVYYNLILLKVDKEKEFQEIEKELGKP